MQVSLLGPLSAEADGLALSLGGRKQRAVFALLALNANRVVSLDRLVHELWLDEPPARATLALQSYVSRLRRLLSAVVAGADDVAIVTRPPGWVLSIPAEHVDALLFQAQLQEAQQLIDEGQPLEGAGRLRAALDLWHGEPLADLEEAPFAAVEAARLTQLKLAAQETLMEAELAVGRAGAVVDAARKFVDENPFRERAWCALILSLYRSGRQAEALAAARELRETLADGLGLDPSPDVRELEEQIFRQDPVLSSVAPPRTRARAAEPDMPPHDDADGVSGPGDLLGRGTTLAALERAVADAVAGRGRVVVVEGPAGIGKTSVLDVLIANVTAKRGLALRGAGVATGAMPALWPWITMLRQLLDARPGLAGPAAGPATAALALLDASGGAGMAMNTWGDDPVLARTRLYRGVVDLIGGELASGPVAVVVDDAHWLDDESLSLMALAADALLSRGALFVLAGRTDEPRAIETFLAAARQRDVLRLNLEGLSEADVALVIQRVSGVAAEPAVTAAVCARTVGNPFFVLELVQLLTSERRLDPEAAYSVLPDGVRDVLRRRLDRLPEQTLALLSVAAVVARPVTVELLVRVTGLDEDSVLDGCESAVLAGLLVDGGAAGFALSHDLVRQTVDESVSGARRVRLHLRVARALQQAEVPGAQLLPEQVVEIARHLTLAAPVAGPQDALPYLLAAADDARARLAFHQSEDFLKTALKLAGQVPSLVLRVQATQQVRGRLASMMVMGPEGSSPGHPDEVLPPLDPAAPAEWWAITVLTCAIGRAGEALASAEEAAAQSLPLPAQVAVHSLLGFSQFLLGRLREADEAFLHCDALASEGYEAIMPGVFTIPVATRALRSAIALLMRDEPTADTLLSSARQLAGSSAPDLVIVEYYAAWTAAARGAAAAALLPAETCVALASELGDSLYVPLSEVIRCWALAMTGDASALDVADAACEDYLARGFRYQSVVSMLLRAEAHAHLGRADQAISLVSRAHVLAEETGESVTPQRLSSLAATLEALTRSN